MERILERYEGVGRKKGWGIFASDWIFSGSGIYSEGFGVDFQPIWVRTLIDLKAISEWIPVAFGVSVRLGRRVF